jgi:hypothetical protein
MQNTHGVDVIKATFIVKIQQASLFLTKGLDLFSAP